jgi:hypothetical protein
MHKKILIIYRLILIFGVLILFAWLLQKNIVMKGDLSLSKDFCFSSRFISNLYPEDRAGILEKDEAKNCFQRIFVEPAYFKVKIPRTFDTARVTVIYANPNQAEIKLGLLKKREYPLDWRFSLKDLQVISWEEDQGGNVWLTAEADFTAGEEHLNDHALEFFFSSPGLIGHRYQIKVKKIEVELVRSASNWSDFFRDVKNYLINKTKNVRAKFK